MSIEIDDFQRTNVSDIKLERVDYAKDFGMEGFVLESLYADVIFAEYVDEAEDGIVEYGDSGLVGIQTGNSTWRKAVVRMISPFILTNGRTKVGDIILFPNDKGLPTGRVKYKDSDGNVIEAKNAIFLNEQRILAKVSAL